MPNVVRIPVAAGAFDPSDITLTDDTSGALLIKEGSNEYMRINTTNSAEQTIFANGSSNEYIKIDTTSGQPGVTIKMPTGVPLRFQADQYQGLNAAGSVYRAFNVGSANNWSFGDLTTGSPGHLRGYANDIRIIHSATGGSNSGVQMRARGAGTGDTFKIQSDTETNFEIDQDSNATFTLDSGGANYFTVKNDVSASHCFRVNGQNRHTEIERIGYAGTQYLGYSGDYLQRSQPACVDSATHATGVSTLAVPDMNGSPGSGTFNFINRRTAIRIHSASQSASGDLFTATLNVGDNYDQLIREMFLYVSNYDSTNNFALKIQASAGSGNWRELNSSGITGVSGQTIDAATTYVYRIFQYAPGATAATRVYGIHFMGKMAH